MIIARAEYQYKRTNFFDTEYIVGCCSNCGAEVTRSTYGRDEECSKCNAYIDWFWEKENEERNK